MTLTSKESGEVICKGRVIKSAFHGQSSRNAFWVWLPWAFTEGEEFSERFRDVAKYSESVGLRNMSHNDLPDAREEE